MKFSKKADINKKKIINWQIVVLIILSFVLPALTFAKDNNIQNRVCINVSIANMRADTSVKGDVLWQTEQYHPLMVIQTKGKWKRVKDFAGDTAWVHESLVKNISCVITVKDQCNIRSEPSIKGQILFVAEKGVPFKVIEKRKNWFKIEHADGDEGWIYKKLVW